MSTPISFSSKPPSLFANASVQKQQQEEPPKKRRARGKKKKSKPQSGGGDTEMVSLAPGLIDSEPPYYQTRKKEFTFSEDASETEDRSIDSPETLNDVDFSKVNLGPEKRQVPLEGMTVQKSGGSVSEDADPESESEGGDAEMVSIAASLIDSPPPYYKTRKKEFTFFKDASETEARSIGSPETLSDVDFSKVNLGPKKGQVPREVITIRKSRGSVSEGAGTESNKSDSTSTDSSDGDSHSDGECLESVIGRRLFELPCTNGLINSFKARVKTNVLKQIRGVVDKEPTTELVLEIADSIDLLRLLGASTPMLDDIGSKAREGALLYEEGLEVLNKGQEMLRSCISDIYSLK